MQVTSAPESLPISGHRTSNLTCFRQAGTTQLLIDCGVAQDNDADENAEPAKFPFDPSKINAVILTHGHLDHTGKIPQLVRAGFRGKIYGHYATCVIARIIWEDSLHHDNHTHFFDQNDINATIGRCMPVARRRGTGDKSGGVAALRIRRESVRGGTWGCLWGVRGKVEVKE